MKSLRKKHMGPALAVLALFAAGGASIAQVPPAAEADLLLCDEPTGALDYPTGKVVLEVIARINRSAYVDLVQGGEIDIAISPAQATVGPLLSKIRRGDMVAVHSLRRGAAEVLEVVVHGDAKTSRVVGRRIEEIDLPDGATIAAIIRNNDVIIAHHDTLIEAEDHLIVFALNKRIIPKVEKLLQVGFGFF